MVCCSLTCDGDCICFDAVSSHLTRQGSVLSHFYNDGKIQEGGSPARVLKHSEQPIHCRVRASLPDSSCRLMRVLVLHRVLCALTGVLRYVIETADLDDVLEVGQTDWTPNLKVRPCLQNLSTAACINFPSSTMDSNMERNTVLLLTQADEFYHIPLSIIYTCSIYIYICSM